MRIEMLQSLLPSNRLNALEFSCARCGFSGSVFGNGFFPPFSPNAKKPVPAKVIGMRISQRNFPADFVAMIPVTASPSRVRTSTGVPSAR